mgnify:CR=1 FL=1
MRSATALISRLIVIVSLLALALAIPAAPPPARADTVYQPLPFNQDWSDLNQITTDDDWSGVPGIVAYRGEGMAGNTTGVDPQPVLEPGSGTDLDVDAQADAATLAPGGVAEFDSLADPTIAIAGDPTAEYGIRFRQSGPGDYLLFSISGTGYYRLVRVHKEQYEQLVPWTFDGRIKTGPGAVNRLRVVARGADIVGSINGNEVVRVKDEIDVGGQLTLGLQTYDAGGVAVRFDNIEGRVGELDLREDFSDPARARWSSGGAQIADGQYEIIAGAGIQTWQQPLPTGSSRVSDFSLEVDAMLANGEGDGIAYGVMFGDGGSFDFYSLLIFPEGGLALLRQDPVAGSQILVPPVLVEAVKPGTGQTNTIRIEVTGNLLSVAVNGNDLGQLELEEDIQGMVGLIVSSGTANDVRVRFDNFRLEEKTP